MIDKFNTGETPAELKEKYNPEGSILRRAQKRMLEMLLYLDNVCKKLKINYRLDGGNVLGAVRHGGFIPWDDDVDVVIESKKEYKRLCKFLLRHAPKNGYVLQNHKTDPHYYQFWSVLRDSKSEYIQNDKFHNIRKFKGLQIDIFPMESKRIVLLNNITRKISYFNNEFFVGKHSYLASIIFCLQKNIIIPIFNIISFFWGNPNFYMHSYGDYFKSRRHKDILFPHSNVKFEGFDFPAPHNIDAFLTSIYKDYMELPAIDKRNHHQAQYKVWD